jgi:septal ring factor EnvC (AmiA/AmiB activator)
MFEIIISSLPAIISALGGAGLFAGASKIYRTYHKQQRRNESHRADLSNSRSETQASRIDDLRQRVSNVENRIDKERKARVEAEVRNKQLQATISAMSTKIDQLVAMVQDLRDEADMEPLTDKEKKSLKETPDFSKANTN